MSNLLDAVSRAARYLARPFVSLYRWLIAARRKRTSPSAVQQPQPAVDLPLDDYGRALVSYSGTGTVNWEDGSAKTLAFNAAQFPDGRIVVLGYYRNDDAFSWFGGGIDPEPVSFSGITTDGWTLTNEGNARSTNYLPKMTIQGSYAALRLNQLECSRTTVAAVTATALSTSAVLKTDRSVVDAYLDAKVEHDFLETRAGKLALAIEKLKHAFLHSGVADASEYVVPDATFRPLAAEIVAAIRPILEKAGIHATKASSIASEGKIRGLNRAAFRGILKALCRYTSLTVPPDEIELFILCRDYLVHTGQFYCQGGTAEEWAKHPPAASQLEEFCFMISFLDRVFLKLFGYSGEYFDWRDFPHDQKKTRTLPLGRHIDRFAGRSGFSYPRGSVNSADRTFPLILPTHYACNHDRHLEDQTIGQLVGILHQRAPDPEHLKMELMAGIAADGQPFVAAGGFDLRAIIRRWVLGFHAALYGEFADVGPNLMAFPPLAEADKDTGQLQPVHPIVPEMIRVLRFNRELGKVDRVVTRNGKCVYECVWIESNTPGVWFCAYALDLYGWVHLGDVDRFGRRGCVGNYIRADDTAPPEGTKGDRHPDDYKPDHELDPFPRD